MQRIRLCCVNLFLRQLVVRQRIEPFHALCNIAVSDPLHFQLVHSDEIRNLLEADRRIVHQPDGCGLGHNRFCHAHAPVIIP